MVLRLALFFVLNLAINFQLYAQSFKYKHFDVDDGLPSSQVFSAFQDKEGYMWFTTDNGLSRFDGYSFQNFSTKDGIIDNTILSGTVAQDSSILFFTLSSGFFWYKNGQFYKIKSKAYNRLINTQRLKITNYALDKYKTIWFRTNQNGIYYSLDLKGKITKYKCKPITQEQKGTYLIQIDANNLLPIANHGYPDKDITNYLKSIYKNHPFVPHVNIKFAVKQNNAFILIPNKDKEGQSVGNVAFFYTPRNKITHYYFQTKKGNQIYNSSILDEDSKRWMGTEKGVFMYEPDKQKPIHILEENFITNIFQDFEKNVWITTKDKGVFLITGSKIENYLTSEKITSFTTYDDKLWVTSITGKIFNIDTTGLFTKVLDKKTKNIVMASSISKNGIFLFDGVYNFSGERKKTFKKKELNAKAVIQINNSQYVIGTHNGILIYDLYRNTLDEHLGPRIRISSLYKNSSNSILIGTVKGLFSFNISNKTYTGISRGQHLLSNRIMDIKEWGSSYILATKGNGIVIYGNDTLYAITKDNGLKSNLISCATVVNDTVIWVGSNTGVAKIEFNYTKDKIKSISNYTHIDGLSANEVTDIISFNNNIWVGTSKGISLLPLNGDNSFTVTPKLKVNGFYVNNSLVSGTNNYTLKPNENNISISYLGVSFKSLGKLSYRYKLNGYINEWVETKSKNVNFTNIPAGDYTFELQAMNKNGMWSSSKVVNFSIAKHFTQEIWFIVLIILVIVSIPSGIILVLSKNKRARERQKRRALEAELFALRTQINPHFIFNALNSIQAYNVKARDKEAIKYLSNFSELMRQILENTKHSFITLYDEIGCITNYLKLESLRTNGRFTYTIEVDEGLEALHVYLPPMLIQPHLENAIWKGFTDDVSAPHISIIFSKLSNKLNISIKDNGIGINKGRSTIAKTTKISGYSSTGIKNILDRLESIKQLYDIDIIVDVFDISERRANQTGTEVNYTITLLKELPNKHLAKWKK
jgi:ligand-binding sensor domain-containing protein